MSEQRFDFVFGHSFQMLTNVLSPPLTRSSLCIWRLLVLLSKRNLEEVQLSNSWFTHTGEMDAVDLSAWLGKPPTTPKIQQNSELTEDAESESDSSHGQSTAEDAEPAEPSDSDVQQPQSETEEGDELAFEEEDPSFFGSTSRLQNGFFIDIPKILNKDDYEHLPGYFTVDRVLSGYSQGKYLVKLGSGELELVSVPKFSPSY